MTTLSATFVFLGFIAYLYSRRILQEHPRFALSWMSVSLILGTSLAALAKENGALLPLFILVAEATILRDRPKRDYRFWWSTWQAIFLATPALVLIGYLAWRSQYDQSVFFIRDFSVSDRVLTQAHILWQYLYRGFIPATSGLGPFHDNQPIYTDWLHPLSVLAVAGWIALVGTAVAMRRRVAWLSFAVGWYLVGHALESTTIPLELYFEHRNYVPLIGPVFALVAVILSAAPKWQKIARGGLLAYGLLLALVLFSTTSLWGRPLLAAEMWAASNPDSKRAAQYLAQHLELAGDQPTARRVLRRYLDEHPGSAGVALQILALSCLLEPKESHGELLELVDENLTASGFEHGVFEILRGLYHMAKDERCDAIDRRSVYAMAALAITNPAFQANSVAHHNLHVLMAEEAVAKRNIDLTMFHIESALSAHYSITTLTFAVEILNSAGLQSASERFVQDAYAHLPSNPMRAAVWKRRISHLEKGISRISTL
jgi:hypothetical protein